MTQGIAILDTYDQITAALEQLDDATAVALLERLIRRRTPEQVRAIRTATVKAAKAKKAPAPKPAVDTDDTPGKYLCECCGDRFRGPKQFGQHMSSSHWDDVIEEYALNGAHGLQSAFGISPGTASAWAKKIDGGES